jgi:hypothetical protein
MIRPRFAVAVAVALCFFGAAAQSNQPPKPREQPKTSESKEGPERPIQITIQGPLPDPKTTEQEAADRHENLEIQRKLAQVANRQFWTMVVQAIFGILAFGVATLATLAAKKSADIAEMALRTSERAYLDICDFSSSNIAVRECPRIYFRVRNMGRTPSHHTTVRGSFHFGPSRPKEPTAELTTTIQNKFISANSHIGVTIDLGEIETEESLAIINNGGLYVFVEVTYMTFGVRRTFRACLEQSKSLKQLVLANNDSYHYAD